MMGSTPPCRARPTPLAVRYCPHTPQPALTRASTTRLLLLQHGHHVVHVHLLLVADEGHQQLRTTPPKSPCQV